MTSSRSFLALWLAILASGCAERTELSEPESTRPPVEARAAVDRAVATTGDLITYRVTVDSELGYEVEIPEAGADIAGFRIVDVGREEPQEKKGRLIDERWYRLRADLVGSYVLPPVMVRFRRSTLEGEQPDEWQTVSASEIFVEVESVLPVDGEAEDIRGLKPLRRIGRPMLWLWSAVGLIGSSLLIALGWVYLRRRARRARALPPIPPQELAFQALAALRRTDFEDPEAVRRFYFEISEAIRAYVEGRFGLNATDLTTEEIVTSLPALDALAADQNKALRRFLMDTDQVKFAHHEPSRSDIEDTYERALRFVEATVPAVQEPQQEAA